MMNGLGFALIAILAWGVLAFGAVYPWAYWPLAAASAVFGAWGLAYTHGWRDPRIRTLAYAVTVILAAIVVQIVALPYSLVGRLSPSLDEFFRNYRVAYVAPDYHSLSLDAGATFVNFCLAGAFGTLLVGLTRTVRYLRLDWVTGQVMGLGVALAVVGLVQKAAYFGRIDDGPIYGFWTGLESGDPFGPFLNRNHFAGWMLMVAPLVASYAWALAQVSRRDDFRGTSDVFRWLISMDGNRVLLVAIATLLLGVSVIISGSRSGMAGFAVVIVALGYFVVGSVTGRSKRMVVVTALVALLGTAVVWAGAETVVARFGRVSGDIGGRLGAWNDTLRIIDDFPVAGTGLGGYREAMYVYQTADRFRMYAQAHNDYLQLAAEGGVLVGVPAVILLVVVVLGIRRRLRAGDDNVLTYWLRRGAVAGLVGIAAQSLVEFSLQIPGNTVMCVLLLAITLHRPVSRTDAHRV